MDTRERHNLVRKAIDKNWGLYCSSSLHLQALSEIPSERGSSCLGEQLHIHAGGIQRHESHPIPCWSAQILIPDRSTLTCPDVSSLSHWELTLRFMVHLPPSWPCPFTSKSGALTPYLLFAHSSRPSPSHHYLSLAPQRGFRKSKVHLTDQCPHPQNDRYPDFEGRLTQCALYFTVLCCMCSVVL